MKRAWLVFMPVLLLSVQFLAAQTIVVSNTNEEVNGDTSSPATLAANNGGDGISLNEAILAAGASAAYDTIKFDPLLTGSVIYLNNGLEWIRQGNLTINGDTDNDTIPDITIDGTICSSNIGLTVSGALHVVIKCLALQNFQSSGISVETAVDEGFPLAEDLVIRHCTISNMGWAGVTLMMHNQGYAAIRNVKLVENTIQYCNNGVQAYTGMGENASDNEISGLSIIKNTIINSGYSIGIFISITGSPNASRNSISDVHIRGNQISGHTNASILIDAANQADCMNNTIDGIVIAENIIDGTPVTIELVSVGGSGVNATGNVLSDVTIKDNVLTNGGIQFGGATGSGAYNNTISSVLIDRNHISSCENNGIFLIAGSGGAHNNLIENIVLRNTFVGNSSDAGVLLHGETSTSPNNDINGVTIANMTLVNNGVGSSWAGGLNINSKNSSNQILNVKMFSSILWGNGGGDAIRGSLVPDSVKFSILGDGRFLGSNENLYTSPDFVNPGTNDYRLQPGSPCVDTGDTVATDCGPEDLDNKIRVWDGDSDTHAVVDRGAWEYNSTSPIITVISPNGGESWQMGNVHDITWTSSGTSGTMQIEYSTNNGSVWTDVIDSTANNGNYSWTIPDTSSNICLIRVSDKYGTSIDQSDSVFTITNVPENYQLENETLGSDDVACYDAIQNITVAGGVTTVVFESGSSSTLIAGESIRFMPGFHARSNSYMNAYITTDGTFCDISSVKQTVDQSKVKSVLIKTNTIELSSLNDKKSVKVFPNPNYGNFTIELTNFESCTDICIYNMLSEKVYQSSAKSTSNHVFNLPEIKKGIYLVKVSNGKEQFITKIIVKD
ncbi:MAG: T9SS type A sorting domain-containing protein [Prolixibacteraceae bacterium]|nr:T9SS type A sorting domain-containing protein [Prolixibacteraceae bacterium]